MRRLQTLRPAVSASQAPQKQPLFLPGPVSPSPCLAGAQRSSSHFTEGDPRAVPELTKSYQ